MKKFIYLLLVLAVVFVGCEKEEVEPTPQSSSSTVTPPTDDFIGTFRCQYYSATCDVTISDSAGSYIVLLHNFSVNSQEDIGPLVGVLRERDDVGEYIKLLPCTDGCHIKDVSNLERGEIWFKSNGKLEGEIWSYDINTIPSNSSPTIFYEL